jgi:hypothetical protein
MELPSDEDTALVREYKEILRSDGGVQVDLSEQVRLEFSLYENGKRSVISNEEEFRAVSSNGNSALITAMFLMGFVQMIRGSSPVRLVWVTDELGRFDAKNVGAFLKTLALNNIDVISASPSVDPALARHFPRSSCSPRVSLSAKSGLRVSTRHWRHRKASSRPRNGCRPWGIGWRVFMTRGRSSWPMTNRPPPTPVLASGRNSKRCATG